MVSPDSRRHVNWELVGFFMVLLMVTGALMMTWFMFHAAQHPDATAREIVRKATDGR